MEKTTRQGIFEKAAKQLRLDFEALTTVPHSGLRGEEAEKLVRRFLNEHFPRRFDVGSGFIIDSRDVISRQTDVIIYDALNCPTYRVSDTAGIYPANNVAAVVEVKSRLDGNQLTDAFDKIESVKSLAKIYLGDDKKLAMDQTHGSVFAFNSDLTLETISKQYVNRFRTHSLGPHADIICVLDVGIVTTVAHVRTMPGWSVAVIEDLGGDAGEGAHVGAAVLKLGQNTLDVYFRMLLAQVALFRSMVDHPGFDWENQLPGMQMEVTYITSLTAEKDPIKREQKIKEYAAQAREELFKP